MRSAIVLAVLLLAGAVCGQGQRVDLFDYLPDSCYVYAHDKITVRLVRGIGEGIDSTDQFLVPILDATAIAYLSPGTYRVDTWGCSYDITIPRLNAPDLPLRRVVCTTDYTYRVYAYDWEHCARDSININDLVFTCSQFHIDTLPLTVQTLLIFGDDTLGTVEEWRR